MPTNFHVGQKLVCIDFSDVSFPNIYGLEPNKVITVKQVKSADESVGGQIIWFTELVPSPGGPWHSNRFVAVEHSAIATESKPIDDYVCKVCSNPKCSQTEKSCWKCGEPIKV